MSFDEAVNGVMTSVVYVRCVKVLECVASAWFIVTKLVPVLYKQVCAYVLECEHERLCQCLKQFLVLWQFVRVCVTI